MIKNDFISMANSSNSVFLTKGRCVFHPLRIFIHYRKKEKLQLLSFFERLSLKGAVIIGVRLIDIAVFQ